MKAITGALVVALVFTIFGSQNIDACGGMTTVNPPPIVFDDPVAPPDLRRRRSGRARRRRVHPLRIPA